MVDFEFIMPVKMHAVFAAIRMIRKRLQKQGVIAESPALNAYSQMLTDRRALIRFLIENERGKSTKLEKFLSALKAVGMVKSSAQQISDPFGTSMAVANLLEAMQIPLPYYCIWR